MPSDRCDGLVHRLLHPDRRARAGISGDAAQRGGKDRRAPPAVAAGSSEAGHLSLNEHDVEGSVQLGQPVGSPQSSEAGTNDGNVSPDVARQRSPRLPVLPSRVVPEAQPSVGASRAHGPAGPPCSPARPRLERVDHAGLGGVRWVDRDDVSVLDLHEDRGQRRVVVEVVSALGELDRAVEGLDIGLGN